MKSYSHFSKNERFFLDCAFNVEHKSIREIAKILGKSPSSVSRDIKKNFNQIGHVSAIADKFNIQNRNSIFTDKTVKFLLFRAYECSKCQNK